MAYWSGRNAPLTGFGRQRNYRLVPRAQRTQSQKNSLLGVDPDVIDEHLLGEWRGVVW